ncbi:hypothetical protein [Sphingopyxis witflariensis]|uniref:hypothetical protein n=1 Tax=Sphingopyxis witflariensis TaxID=173675 RepID=UPI001181C16C|nr:hypothetical protein [Sphingopyxis witflariensis]
MTRALTALAVLLAGVALPGVAVAATAAPHLWAVRGLYGLDHSACTPPGDLGDTAMIAPALCNQLGEAERQRIGQRFVEAMAAHFPGVEARFAQSLPADVSPRARLASSLIASLRLTRATIWTVDKGVRTDGFLPITLALDISNGATGEVVFTRTHSLLASGPYAAGTAEQELARQFPAKLDQAMQALIVEAAADWKPYAQSATVVGRVENGWVVDRGRGHGLRIGDAIGDDGHIVYAGADYAVVRPVLGEYRTGQILARTAVQPAAMLAKPSLLTSFADVPQGYAKPFLTSIFEDAVGASGGFAPMPVNPGFSSLRAMALGEAQALSTDSRSLPDYVASIGVTLLPSATFPSNIPGVAIDRHEAHAFVELIDRSGRIVFTAHGQAKIVDEAAAGIRFSIEQRHDTVIRNALIDAAAKLWAFKPQPLSLPIAEAGGRMVIADRGGALPIGAQLKVLRKAGRMPGVAGAVFEPVGEIRVEGQAEGGMLASNADIAPLRLRSGDVVAIESAGPPLIARRPVKQCGVGRVDDRGPVPIAFWRVAASARFAAHFPAPVHSAGLADRLQILRDQFADWDSFAPAQDHPADYCFIPVIGVAPESNDAKGRPQYSLAVGYTLMRDETKLSGGGLRAVLTPTALPAGVDPASTRAMLLQDVMAQALPLADRAVVTLKPPL